MIPVKGVGSVLTFGEMLLRLSLDDDGQWLKKGKLPFYVGGAELNVATALSLWGNRAKYLTALPDNFMTDQLIRHISDKGIDMSAVRKCGERLGQFYLSEGNDVKHDNIIYDRAYSAFAGITTGMINWDNVLDDVRWFHFSAISPALSQQSADVCKEALKAARERGITISVDLNYRAKLWQYGKHPVQVMPALAEYCDVVMGNIWAAEKMLGLPLPQNFKANGEKGTYNDAALNMSAGVAALFPNCKAIANTFRIGEKNTVQYFTTLYIGEIIYKSATYTSAQVVDTVGSGDCFMAGLIHGACNKYGPLETLNYATAAAFTKLFIRGDATELSVEQVKNNIK